MFPKCPTFSTFFFVEKSVTLWGHALYIIFLNFQIYCFVACFIFSVFLLKFRFSPNFLIYCKISIFGKKFQFPISIFLRFFLSKFPVCSNFTFSSSSFPFPQQTQKIILKIIFINIFFDLVNQDLVDFFLFC